MRFKGQFLDHYVRKAPLPLALERVFECVILSQRSFERPILDVGCGDGIFAHCLFDEPVDVGIDPDPVELERARQSGAYMELICCSGYSIPKKDGAFKTIFSNSVLEHIDDIEGVLRECRRLIREDGKMFITVPMDRFDQYTVFYQISSALGLKSIAEKFRVFFNTFWKHAHHYDVEGWKGLFSRCGFSVLDVREYNPKFNCVLNDFIVPFSLISFLSRKFLKRWFFAPKLRAFYAGALSSAFGPVVQRNVGKNQNGGLIFFELKKNI